MIYRNVYIEGVLHDITVADGRIAAIEEPGTATPSEHDGDVRDCKGLMWALPALVNMHAHSAMTLLRSAGSGLPLMQWLNEAIFPKEARLTGDDILRGARMACREMKETGTSTFNDMYFNIDATVQAACETGMNAAIALSMTDRDFDNPEYAVPARRFLEGFERRLADAPRNIRYAMAPHSIYAVSGRHLKYLADFAAEHGVPLHMHISETLTERENCLKEHGVAPVVYLDRLGVLDTMGSRLIGAHALWLDDTEIELLGSHHASVVHCPNSNLKLGSGCRFRYTELRDAGANVTLGTDGCASSDNLDMVEAMKVMSLLQKGTRNDPSVLNAGEVLTVASSNGLQALGFGDNGIATGNRADFMLVDLSKRPFEGLDFGRLTPPQLREEFLNRFIYAAHGDAVAETVTWKQD